MITRRIHSLVDFGASWPAAHAQLSALLRSRGVQPADIDDVAQEVALRALSDCQDFESDGHFVAWCCRVAINLHIDSTRRQRRLSPEPPAETEDGQDTAATAQRRMALGVLADRIGELSDDDRRLLFDSEPTGSRRDAVRLAVRRHRLRARLAALVEGMVAGVAWVRRVRFPRGVSTPAKLSLAIAPLVAAGLMLGPFATNGASPSAPGTVPSTHPRVLTRATLPRVAPTRVGAPRTTGATPGARPARPATPSTAGAASSKVIVGARPAGVPVQVSKDERPPSGQLVCTGGLVNECVAKPPLAQVPGASLTRSGG